MSEPGDPSKRTYVVDPSYRMSASEKSDVMYIFDVVALERLISMLPPEDREEMLSYFQYSGAASNDGPPKLVRLDDPDLQAVLGRVGAGAVQG